MSKKNIGITMILSYVLMIMGLLIWDWGAILFISIFTLGLPIVILILPGLSVLLLTAKTVTGLIFALICSLTSLIPLIITITSLPLRSLVTEAGEYSVTPTIIAPLIIVATLIFLLSSINLFILQYRTIKKGLPNDR